MLKRIPTSGPFSSILRKINERLSAWKNGHIIPGQDPDFIRRDDLGNVISYTHYGSYTSEYGWEIERTRDGNEANSEKLRPLHVSRIGKAKNITRFTTSRSR